MPEIEIVADSHIEPTQPTEQEETLSATYEAFGIAPKAATDDEKHDEEGRSVNDPPAKEEAKTETAKRVVKFNKEDREIDESEVEELLQKGLGLDQERARTKQRETELDRAAKLLGYKDHAELTANLDVIEKQQQQKQQNEFETLKAQLRQEFIDNNLDPVKAESYIETHPLLKRAREIAEKEEQRSTEQQIVMTQQETAKKWDDLYKSYPDLVESSQAFNDGKDPEWFTAEMKARVSRGYDPKDAYELANKDKLTTKSTKAAEQKAIKDVQLGNRSAVETVPMGGQENQASEELRNAFSMFGLDPKRANKYVKK